VALRLRAPTPEILERWNIDRSKAGVWTMIDVMWAIRQYETELLAIASMKSKGRMQVA